MIDVLLDILTILIANRRKEIFNSLQVILKKEEMAL